MDIDKEMNSYMGFTSKSLPMVEKEEMKKSAKDVKIGMIIPQHLQTFQTYRMLTGDP